jgi:hypothetical protein
MPESQESRTQEEMKNLMMKELSCATFFVDLTNQDAIFYADSNNVQEVLDHLQRRYNLNLEYFAWWRRVVGDQSAVSPWGF